MAAKEWSVLIFGDSWVQYMYPTWPQVLAQRLGARAFQFAQSGSMCRDLLGQLQQVACSPHIPRGAGGLLKKDTLVVVHTCGNDFIMKIAQIFMGGGNIMNAEFMQPNPGASEAAVMRQFLETMHGMGARNFLVSSVPIFTKMPVFNIAWPIIGGLINQGALESLGVSPGDPPELAMLVQGSALHERWVGFIDDFNKAHPDSSCLLFDEVEALHSIRTTLGEAAFDSQMWDFSMFHPSPFGHTQLASEAHLCLANGLPALAALAPHPQMQAQPASVAVAPEVASSPSTPATTAISKSEALKLRIKTVKGDEFSVSCPADNSVAKLKQIVLETAPASVAPSGTDLSTVLLAFSGSFLENERRLEELKIANEAQLVLVIKPPKA